MMMILRRLPSNPSESELLLGDTERRSGVYKEVHEHSSTGSTQQEADYGGLEGGLVYFGRRHTGQFSFPFLWLWTRWAFFCGAGGAGV
ncbi:MAG: hypothetical protein LBJ69_00315 [Holosporales bacterium]|nr:hypothetical protein [Holosporales bacterium]